MLAYIDGNLFLSPARVLVNTVNCVGVMGKGIAKDFKFFFPEMFKEYQIRCENKSVDIGKLFLFRGDTKWVLNFPTKLHWRNPSKPEYIEAGLKAFVAGYARNGITSIAFPRLGCGNGELDWEKQVRPMMEKYLSDLPIEVFIHDFWLGSERPEHQDLNKTKEWLRSDPENLGFVEVWEDIAHLLHKKKEFLGLMTPVAFTTELVDKPEDGLQIHADGASFFVPKNALLEAWQHLRSSGFVSTGGLVEGLDRHADQVLALFAELPYVRIANIAQFRTNGKQQFEKALQYMPRPSTKMGTADLHQARLA